MQNCSFLYVITIVTAFDHQYSTFLTISLGFFLNIIGSNCIILSFSSIKNIFLAIFPQHISFAFKSSFVKLLLSFFLRFYVNE